MILKSSLQNRVSMNVPSFVDLPVFWGDRDLEVTGFVDHMVMHVLFGRYCKISLLDLYHFLLSSEMHSMA